MKKESKEEKLSEEKITPELIWAGTLELAQNENLIPRAFIISSLKEVDVNFGDNRQFVLYVSHSMQRIRQEYHELLSECLGKVCKGFDIEPLELQVLETKSQTRLPFLEQSRRRAHVPAAARMLDPKFTFDNFVSGASANMAFQACSAVAESLGEEYNPLFLYGEVGLGKTHLLQAIANFVQEHYKEQGYKVRYLTTDAYISGFTGAIREGSSKVEEFKNSVREVDVLLLDDIQTIANAEATKEELFNTINELLMAGRQVVLAADRKPANLKDIHDRLRTRFAAGLVIDIKPPDMETRIAILHLKAAKMNPQFTISDETFSFIAENFSQNIRELESALIHLMADARFDEEKDNDYINLSYAQKSLGPLMGDDWNKSLTPQTILEISAEYFRCTVSELISPKRTRQITTARHMTMYVMREITQISYPQIGEIFGGKDHSTVQHAIKKKVLPSMKEDKAYYDQIKELLRILKTKDTKSLKEVA